LRWLWRGIIFPTVSDSNGNQTVAVFLQQFGLRVELQEAELQRRVKQAGGKLNSTKQGWEIHYDQAVTAWSQKADCEAGGV